MNNYILTRRSNYLLLLMILSVFFVIRLVSFIGIVGADDVSIASNSLKVLSEGLYVPFDHYSSRVGLVYPQALIFLMLGVGEWQLALIPMLSSLSGILLAYLIGKHYGGERVGLLAAFVLAIFPLDAYFSSTLMPDLPLGVMIALAFYLLISSESTQRPDLAILAGLFWGWAYLIKVEAFFFLFVVLTLWIIKQLSWRNVFICAVSVGAVVLAEHIIYFIYSGDPLLRLHLATKQGGEEFVSEFSASQLWVFPKAWFLTPYYYGLHYYLLFFSIVWWIFRGYWKIFPIVIWVGIFLLWFQFGGNPLSESYSVKTHLDRYCNMINVPMAVLIAFVLYDLKEKWGRFLYILTLTGLTTAALLFIPFNSLSGERQAATKLLLDIVKVEELYPLYLDRTSLALASMYLYESAQEGKLHTLQKHDFRKQETIVPDLKDVSGYVLVNRGFVDYGYNRYLVKRIVPEDFSSKFEIYRVADNPMPDISYFSARVLSDLAELIPLERFRKKVKHTAESLLDGDDAVLMKAM